MEVEGPQEIVEEDGPENEGGIAVPGFSPGVLMREDDIKNDCQMAYPLISPTWGFSSNNNNTPFLSPSPNGAIYFYNFRNYFDYFNNALKVHPSMQPQPEQPEQGPKQ